MQTKFKKKIYSVIAVLVMASVLVTSIPANAQESIIISKEITLNGTEQVNEDCGENHCDCNKGETIGTNKIVP